MCSARAAIGRAAATVAHAIRIVSQRVLMCVALCSCVCIACFNLIEVMKINQAAKTFEHVNRLILGFLCLRRYSLCKCA